MNPYPMSLRLLLVVAVIGMLAGCTSPSDSDQADDRRGPRALGQVLPPDIDFAAYVDMDAVRVGLGFFETTDVSPLELHWRGFVRYAAPTLEWADGHPVARAIAVEDIREALSGSGTRGLFIVLQTDEPWNDIRTKLLSDGYIEQADETLSAGSSTTVTTEVAQVDGRIVVTHRATSVAEARESTGGFADLLDLLEAAPGAIRAGILVDGGGCGREVAVSSGIPVTGGTWTIGVGPDPSEDRVIASSGNTGGRRGQLVLQQPILDGDYLQLPVLFDESIVDVQPPTLSNEPTFDPTLIWQQGLLLSSVVELAYGTDDPAWTMTPVFDTYDCSAS